jgi:hypothetical protein
MTLDKSLLIEKGLINKVTTAIYDYAFIKELKKIPWAEWVDTPEIFRVREQYLERFPAWIASSLLNRIDGLDAFPVRHLINGTTQTFDEAYYIHKERRLRLFRGEYAYHKRVFANWRFLDDGPVEPGDFLIISAPFCSTGEVHPELSRVLDQAERVGAPVLIDCAYFGTSVDLQFNVDHPAVESVSFSLTKGLGLGDIRSGIRFSRRDNLGPISQQNTYNHSVMCASKIGLYMMERFSPDYIPEKYRAAQLEVCTKLGLKAAKVMHIALADSSWPDFIVDDIFYRVGIRNLVKAYYKGELVSPVAPSLR